MTDIWVITDGKSGDENQCLGVAKALELCGGMKGELKIKRLRPDVISASLMPWGGISYKDRCHLSAPFPAIAIASGRRAVAALRYIKQRSPQTLTVFLKDPRTGIGAADLIWVSAHDGLRGSNVMVTLTSPHVVSNYAEALKSLEQWPQLQALSAPRLAVLVGGDSRHHRFTAANIEKLLASLHQALDEGWRLMLTTSRRTPLALAQQLSALQKEKGADWVYMWQGEPPNPYQAILALAEAVLVTTDSTNMVSEALVTGCPVYIHEPEGGHPKISTFLAALHEKKTISPLTSPIQKGQTLKWDSTPEIAQEIKARLEQR